MRARREIGVKSPAGKPSPQERFAKYVRPVGACLIFIGSQNNKGYGVFSLAGKQILAHRAAWLLSGRTIPDGANVLHACDTPKCVLVAHLFLGTIADNAADMARKGRGVSGKLPYGVYPLKGGRRFAARSHAFNRSVYLGTFGTIEEAASAAREAKDRRFS